jgi:hypothetical protein
MKLERSIRPLYRRTAAPHLLYSLKRTFQGNTDSAASTLFRPNVGLLISSKEKDTADEERRGEAAQEVDGVAVGGLDLGWCGSGVVKALCAALGVGGDGWDEEEQQQGELWG